MHYHGSVRTDNSEMAIIRDAVLRGFLDHEKSHPWRSWKGCFRKYTDIILSIHVNTKNETFVSKTQIDLDTEQVKNRFYI